MNLRPKTKRRLLSLLIGGLALSAVAVVGVVIQLHRYENHRLAFREEAMAAFHRGDYRTAADSFAKYLGNDRVDPEAIFDYAIARTKLPRADLSHLTEARALFSRYLELVPGDVGAQHQLLAIYQKLRYTGESEAISSALLATNPDDVPALQARLAQLVRDGKYAPALAVSQHLNDLQPQDVAGQGTTYEIMSRLHRPASEFTTRADAMMAAHPEDPRFELLRASAVFWTGDTGDAIKWLRIAATRPPPDADFVLMLAGAFDRVGLWSDSARVLEKNATIATASASLKASFAQRLWENQQYDRALAVIGPLNLTDSVTDANLIGLAALIQSTREQTDPVTALAALSKQTDDPVAGGWVYLLQALHSDRVGDVPQAARLCVLARRSDPRNADSCYFSAVEYRRLGENELALQSLAQITAMQPEWAAPWSMMAGLLQQRGQITDARQAAQAALQRDPESVEDQISCAVLSWKHLSSTAAPADVRALLDSVEKLRIVAQGDAELLAAQVDLTARSTRPEGSNGPQASFIALQALANASPSMLRLLAMIDRSDHLEIAKDIGLRLGSCKAKTPGEALDQVEAELIIGNTDAAKSLLPTMETHAEKPWKIATLQAREAVGDPLVADGWAELFNAFPNDVDVDLAVLESLAVQQVRPVMDRAIDRLRFFTGDDGIEWKLARARWELGAMDDPKTAANAAAASMAEVASIAPHYAVPQEIWAQALLKLGDTSGAIGHLRLAAECNPDKPEYPLDLAALLEQQGQFRDAGSVLSGLVGGATLSDSQRMEAARLCRLIGDRATGIKFLDDGQPVHPGEPERDVLIAELLAEMGDDADARRHFDRCMADQSPSPQMIRAFAWFLASRQTPLDQCRQVLAKLDAHSLPPGQKDLIDAEFESRWGDRQTAANEFQDAVKAAPAKPHAWLAWAGMDLRNRDFTGAFSVAQDGLNQTADDPALLAMRDVAQTLAGLKLRADAQGLLEVLSTDPSNEAANAAIKAIANCETDADLTAKLAPVTEKYPRFLPAQTMLIDRDFNDGRIDEAADRASRVCTLLPIDPLPAQLLTKMFLTTHQWDKALTAAREWRERSLDHPREADAAIATALIAMHQPELAEAQLDWCATPAVVSDEQATELYARALCCQGRFNDAWNVVQPLLQIPAGRRAWLAMVSEESPDVAGATQRIQQVEALVKSDSVEDSVGDQIALSKAWYTVATRFNDAPALTRARAVIEPLTDASGTPADAWLLLGTIQQQQNDLTAAQASFTTAMKIAPDLPEVKNDLAMVMLLRNQDLPTAQKLALAAVHLSPVNSAMHSTLGEIDQRMGDLASASREFATAVKLNAQNAEALIGLASVENQLGDRLDARITMQRANAVVESGNAPGALRGELEKLRDQLNSPATLPTSNPG